MAGGFLLRKACSRVPQACSSLRGDSRSAFRGLLSSEGVSEGHCSRREEGRTAGVSVNPLDKDFNPPSFKLHGLRSKLCELPQPRIIPTFESPRWFSTDEQKTPERPLKDGQMPVVYEGPYSAPLKSVKLLSVSTCALSLSLSPIITFYTMPGVDVIAKGSIAALLVLASATTTGALHWLSSPYIHKMRWQKGSPVVEVQMLSWLATEKTEKLKLADVRFPYTSRPLSSFAVNGKFYYIEPNLVESAELLRRLQP